MSSGAAATSPSTKSRPRSLLGEKNHPGYFERIALPHLTWENGAVTPCASARVTANDASPSASSAACMAGSGEARTSWCTSRSGCCGPIAIASSRARREDFHAAQIRDIVEKMDIVLFPQVNPDGRHFSMARHPMWRKNRRPAPRGHGPRSIGVDLNRNFPFLWGFERYFAPGTVDSSAPRRLRVLHRAARGIRAGNEERDLAARSLSQHSLHGRSAQLRRSDPAQLGQR